MNTKNKPNLIIYQKYMSLIYYTNDILKKYVFKLKNIYCNKS